MSQILKGLRDLRSFDRANLAKLGLISLFITLVDTCQSYYGQKVVNTFSEFNAIPAIYYSHGILGYLIYVPIEFSVVFAMMVALWLWSSYIIWYHRNVISKMRIFHSQ